MSEGFNMKMSPGELERLKKFLVMFPEETKQASAKYLNDSARLFKNLAPKVLGSRYTIRDKVFVNRQFKVKKAEATDSLENQEAFAYTKAYKRFSGWEEEITGDSRDQRSSGEGRYHRLIWNTARGGNPQGRVTGHHRLRLEGGADNPSVISDSRDYGLPIPQFLAMLSKSPKDSQGNKRIDGNKVFILDGPGFPFGLYRFKGKVGTSRPELQALQHFTKEPRQAERFDWRQMTEDKVTARFKPSEVWKTYFEPLLANCWKRLSRLSKQD